MGYNTRPEMIEQNAELLNSIKEAVDSGKELRLKVRDQNTISTEQYRLRRLLAATDNHPLTFGGKFSRLGKRVNLRVDSENGFILVQPKGNINVEEYRTDEKDAIEFLLSAKGSVTIVEFWPSKSFSMDEFAKVAAEAGWDVFPSAATTSDTGKIEVPAERRENAPEKGASFDSIFKE
jgi:hypothetical protein